MLSIKNYHKLYRQDVLGYRIASIIENETNYKIKLLSPNSHQLMAYIERDAIDNEYEVWIQHHLKAERMFFDKKHFETMDKFLSCLRVLMC